jgi:RNA ligase (TIGR02306 family)
MLQNGKRAMAWIAKIDEVKPIENADQIDMYRIGGWWVVDKKGAYNVGDLVVYISIDSWIPHELAPFLSKGSEPREYNGVRGERLRTVKLRGQVSQGLLLKPADVMNAKQFTLAGLNGDVSELLNIQKWEAPVPAQLAGDVEGAFPTFIPKTDQERIQNLSEELGTWGDRTWEVTEKLDGSSMTVYHKDGKFGVCSRNWALKETQGNSLWAQARRYDLETVLNREGNYAVQGELIGEGIQGNSYRIRGQDFYVYDVYDINEQRYLPPVERLAFVERNGLKSVPVIEQGRATLASIQDILLDAEGRSVLNSDTEREGLVYKSDGVMSFKAVSNRFLIKQNKGPKGATNEPNPPTLPLWLVCHG